MCKRHFPPQRIVAHEQRKNEYHEEADAYYNKVDGHKREEERYLDKSNGQKEEADAYYNKVDGHKREEERYLNKSDEYKINADINKRETDGYKIRNKVYHESTKPRQRKETQ